VIYAGGKLDRYLEAAGESCKDVVYAGFPELERLTRLGASTWSTVATAGLKHRC
jgi:hypothetical protein